MSPIESIEIQNKTGQHLLINSTSGVAGLPPGTPEEPGKTSLDVSTGMFSIQAGGMEGGSVEVTSEGNVVIYPPKGGYNSPMSVVVVFG
ncbi:hypothetical protein E4U21_005485 [Claviceps maximensis]|nr:hypothetical protein E4U21_005485 [Claviceps maximensis]